MNDHIQGAAKSKTIWAAAALAVLSNVAPLLPVVCATAHLDPATIQIVGTVAAALMAGLRTVTTTSLASKAGPTVLPPPQTGESPK